MTNTVLIKRSGVANSVPVAGNLSLGELAINYNDGNLFYKNSSGVVTVIASNKFVSVTGNVTGGNINTVGVVSATGNVTGNYFIGNGSQLTGITSGTLTSTVNNFTGNGGSAFGLSVTPSTVNLTFVNIDGVEQIRSTYTLSGNVITFSSAPASGASIEITTLSGAVVASPSSIGNGTSNVTVVSSGGNVSVGVGGTGNVAVFATTGEYVTGVVSATGNVTGNYILGNGAFLSGVITSVANINNGTSNVTVVSSGGNITASVGGVSNVVVWATTGEYVTGLLSVSGNITGGNVSATSVTGTVVSVTGNITGSQFNGSGAGLSSIPGANVTGTVPNATTAVVAGTVTTAAQGNITSVGTLTSLAVASTSTGVAKINISDNSSSNAATPLLQFGMVAGNGFSTADAARIWASSIDVSHAILNFASYNGGAPSTAQMSIVNGNVGISNTSPTTTLGVTGTAYVSGNITGGNLATAGSVAVGAATSAYRLTVTGAANTIAAYVLPQGALPDNNDNAGLYVLHQGTAGTAFRARTDNALTGSIFAHVLVNNTSASINGFQVSQYGTGYIADFNKSGTALNSVRIDNNGNVGIGTTSVSYKLTLKQSTGDLQLAMQGAVKNWNFRNQSDGTFGYFDDSLGYWRYYYDTGNNHIWFNATSTERMRIDSAGNLSVVGSIVVNSSSNGTAIVNGAANAVGNIGSSSTYFNRLFAQATTALYADLAEMYRADADYAPGTVLVFGGNHEVTMSTKSHDDRVAGVVSTNPAHIMNAGLSANHAVALALSGRVPVNVVGNIAKGDKIVTSHIPGVAQSLDKSRYEPGVVIGKAVENYNSTEIGVIEVVVGRV
jgi:hypothetical protein